MSEGVDEITDAIEYTIDDHTYRILCCLEKHPEFEDKKEILDYVKSYDFNDNRIQDKLIELETNRFYLFSFLAFSAALYSRLSSYINLSARLATSFANKSLVGS